MTLQELKEQVCEANLALVRHGLVILTWGNVSAVDRERNLIAIKPSGVSYDCLTPDKIVLVDLQGQVVEGSLRPSSDTPTHLVLYRHFTEIRAVAHTHSRYATAWAQAGVDLPCLGTTHADAFYGPVPCTRALRPSEIQKDYESNTGRVIVETFQQRDFDPMACPAVLVSQHGPFTWGDTLAHCVDNAITLEEVCAMGILSNICIDSATEMEPVPQELMDKHYLRKHGKDAYYGQSQ